MVALPSVLVAEAFSAHLSGQLQGIGEVVPMW
jgi:hypothetical protein